MEPCCDELVLKLYSASKSPAGGVNNTEGFLLPHISDSISQRWNLSFKEKIKLNFISLAALGLGCSQAFPSCDVRASLVAGHGL